jgi:hypothetical protein
MRAPEPSADFDDCRPVVNYNELFQRALLCPDPPDKALPHQPGFFRRHRNVIWGAVIFLFLVVGIHAVVTASIEALFDPGCGG